MRFASILGLCLIALSLRSSTATAQRAGRGSVVPSFDDYPATASHRGAGVAPVLRGEARTYRTRIREIAREPVNFAGAYSIGFWGCGTSCLYGAAVHHGTGAVIMLPGTVSGSDDDEGPVDFQRDSRLVRLVGLVNEAGDRGHHYYELEGGRFRHVASAPPSQLVAYHVPPATSVSLASGASGPLGRVRGEIRSRSGRGVTGTLYFHEVTTGAVYTRPVRETEQTYEAQLPVGSYVAYVYGTAGGSQVVAAYGSTLEGGEIRALKVFTAEAGASVSGIDVTQFTGEPFDYPEQP